MVFDHQGGRGKSLKTKYLFTSFSVQILKSSIYKTIDKVSYYSLYTGVQLGVRIKHCS